MLKPLTFSVSLAVALGACGLSLAGDHFGIGKSLPSAQGVVASPQGAILPSAQSCDTGCGTDTCGPVEKKCGLFDMFKHRERCYTYEWVLKKKRVHSFKLPKLFGGHKGGGLCGGGDSCDVCGGGEVAYPSAQWASPQGAPIVAPSGQGIYSSGQASVYGAGQATYGTGQATYGTGQIGATGQAAPAGDAAPAPAATPAPAGDAAPAPEEAPPPAANPATAGLMFLSPAGN